MKKAWLLFEAVFVFGIFGMANATPIIDQTSYDAGWDIGPRQCMAQVSIDNIRGPLAHTDVFVNTWNGFPDYPSTFSLVDSLSDEFWKEAAEDSTQDVALMVLLGITLIGLATFGKMLRRQWIDLRIKF